MGKASEAEEKRKRNPSEKREIEKREMEKRKRNSSPDTPKSTLAPKHLVGSSVNSGS